MPNSSFNKVGTLNQPHFDFDAWQKAIIPLEEAVTLDPQFAEDYALLAKAHSRIYYLRRDHTYDRHQKAERANAQALSVDAGNPEVQMAAGCFQLWVKKDRVAALSFLEQASKGLPNSVEVLKARASIYEVQGKFDLYIEAVEKATNISSLDGSCWTMLAFGYEFTYQFSKGLESITKSTAPDPEAAWNHLAKGFIYFQLKGADEDSREAFSHINKNHSWYLWSMFHQEMFEDRFDSALELIKEYPNRVNSKMARIPQPLLKAYIYTHQNKKEQAKQEFELSLTELKLAIDSKPDDDRTHSALGLSYSGLGMREDAVFHGKKAMELMPYSEEAIYGQPAIPDMALIYTMLGEFHLAFEHLETILAGPSY
jgi:tetratricopeptide (TPR) repeat protein